MSESSVFLMAVSGITIEERRVNVLGRGEMILSKGEK